MELACPTCRRPLSLPAQLPGTLVRCPHCATVLDVSAAMGQAATPQPTYAGAAPPAGPQVAAGGVATAARGAATNEERRPIRRRRQSSGFVFVLAALVVGALVLFGVHKVLQKRRQEAADRVQQPVQVAFVEARQRVAEKLTRSTNLTVPDEHGKIKDLGGGRWRVEGYADEPGLSGPVRKQWVAEMERVSQHQWRLARLEFDGAPVDLGEESPLAGVEDVTDEDIPEFQWIDARGQGADEENPFGDAWQAHGSEFYRDQTVRWAVERVRADVETALGLRKVLLVWLVDQSPSATAQRNDFGGELAGMYTELDVARQAGAGGSAEDAPLLSVVGAFGKELTFPLEEPSGNQADVEAAVRAITEDASGVESTFAAVRAAAEKYQSYGTDKRRSVMIVVVSDEAGDDDVTLEETIASLKLSDIPVSVIGTRAPFGRRMAPVPNPEVPADFGQARGGVPTLRQGPESLLLEHINLAFWNPSMGYDDSELLDSGFGPFSLVRLCDETGGKYYACRMDGGGIVGGRRWSGYGSGGLVHFFDPKIMRRYAPDYVTAERYEALLNENKARQALVDAAKLPRVETMKFVTLSFPKLQDAAANKLRLDDAQKAAATIEPKVEAIYQALKAGEGDRPKLTDLRWQAAYDLAMGRALAAKVRTEGYNAMLAQVKGGFVYKDKSNDVMYLEQADTIGAGSSYERMLKDSRKYLQRVAKEHPGTPWAFLAERELATPCGWQWVEGRIGEMPKGIAQP